MKFIILTAFLFVTVASSAQSGYNIKATLNGVSDSLIYLANYYGDKQYLRDSVKADAKGNVVFKGEKPYEGGIYLIVYPGKRYFEIILDKEQNFSLETNLSDPVNSMKISGSNDNILFYEYLKFIQVKSAESEPYRKKVQDSTGKDVDSAREKLSAIDAEVKQYKKNYIKDHPKTLLASVFSASADPDVPEAPALADGSKDSLFAFYYFRNHYMDGVDFSDERLIRTPVFHNKLNHYIKNLTPQIPDSIIVAADYLIKKAKANKEIFKYTVHFLTYTSETSNVMGMDAVFVHMVQNYYKDGQAFWLDSDQLYKITQKAKTLNPLLLGKKVPPLTLTDMQGIARSLHTVNADYTVLYFWDPDCGHCKKETPKLKAWYDSTKSKGVEVYAVCNEIEIDKWKSYVKENDLTWINVADPELKNNFRNNFDVTTTPMVYVLDKEKKIIAKKISTEQLAEFMKRQMNIN